MAPYRVLTTKELEMVLLVLQAFQVLFLWVHDWIPLGRLNDVAAVRGQDTLRRLIVVTLIQSAPFTVGLISSVRHFDHPFPGWLNMWLWISYAALFVGQIRAWWVPYLKGRTRQGQTLRKDVRKYALIPARA